MSDQITPPARWHQMLEGRVGAEASVLMMQLPLLRMQTATGTGPVMVLPGFMADDASTWLLRRFLGSLGYEVMAWGQGLNRGPMMAYLPTLIAVLGADLPEDRPIDGTNVLPLLEGEDWQRDRPIPFASNMRKDSPPAAIIHQGYKLLMWLDENREDELYQLQEDPREERDLFAQKPVVASSLRSVYIDWLKSARHSFEHGDYPGYERQGSFIKTN